MILGASACYLDRQLILVYDFIKVGLELLGTQITFYIVENFQLSSSLLNSAMWRWHSDQIVSCQTEKWEAGVAAVWYVGNLINIQRRESTGC